MKIAIDLGHGVPNIDTGAEGLVSEDLEVRMIAPYLVDRLKSYGYEIKVIDNIKAHSETESLQKRCDISNEWNADLFVSMHLNAFQATSKAMGCEVVAWSDKGALVAEIVEQYIAALAFKSRGVKKDSLHVLRKTDAVAILIESFFVDSVADVTRYKAIGENRLGYAVAEGIHRAIKEVLCDTGN
jgi:N-acetylmuramoyl-L-alanine amidase